MSHIFLPRCDLSLQIQHVWWHMSMSFCWIVLLDFQTPLIERQYDALKHTVLCQNGEILVSCCICECWTCSTCSSDIIEHMNPNAQHEQSMNTWTPCSHSRYSPDLQVTIYSCCKVCMYHGHIDHVLGSNTWKSNLQFLLSGWFSMGNCLSNLKKSM